MKTKMVVFGFQQTATIDYMAKATVPDFDPEKPADVKATVEALKKQIDEGSIKYDSHKTAEVIEVNIDPKSIRIADPREELAIAERMLENIKALKRRIALLEAEEKAKSEAIKAKA